jgi:cytochrome c
MIIMKKTFVILSIVTLIYSCGNGADQQKAASEPKVEVTKDPEVTKGLSLVAQSDCFTCHKVSETFTGPSYIAVSKKYNGMANIEDTLADKIIKGGAGNWGPVPMTPHPAINKEDAKTMVKYILSLKEE